LTQIAHHWEARSIEHQAEKMRSDASLAVAVVAAAKKIVARQRDGPKRGNKNHPMMLLLKRSKSGMTFFLDIAGLRIGKTPAKSRSKGGNCATPSKEHPYFGAMNEWSNSLLRD
jgi:hypothetical protein